MKCAKVVLAMFVVMMLAGCGIKCTRTVRHMSDSDGRLTVVTEYQEEYPWGVKPPKGWTPDKGFRIIGTARLTEKDVLDALGPFE